MAKREKLEVVPTVLGGFRRHGQNRSLRQIEIYRAEVRASKAYFAPTILKPIITIAYRMASAWAMVKAAGRSDAALSRDLKSIAE